MKEIITTYYDRFNTTKKGIAKTALALGLGASILTGCGSSEGDKTPEATVTPTVSIETATPEVESKCAIVGMEELDFDDPACVIGPA